MWANRSSVCCVATAYSYRVVAILLTAICTVTDIQLLPRGLLSAAELPNCHQSAVLLPPSCDVTATNLQSC